MDIDRGGDPGRAPAGGEAPPARPGAPVPGARAGGGPPPQLVRGVNEEPASERRRRGDSGDARHGVAQLECAKECLPPCLDHEVELLIPDALNYQVGQTVRSDSKIVGNFKFKILVFPCGTHTTQGQQVSAFVEADTPAEFDLRWIFHGVKYQVVIVNWLDYRNSVYKVDTWTFSKDGIDRGWHDMVRTANLSQESGWLGPNNTLCVRAQCYVRQADGININSDNYNTKKETGYIGLKNHGATCYMNGLLQTLFHVGEFRKIVFSIDCEAEQEMEKEQDGSISKLPSSQTIDDEGKAPSLIQALQNVFFKLHSSDQAVDCKELMRSFGWDNTDAFTQHDAQELNRILCDRLEEQMKGTSMDGSIKKLFEGEMENYIQCMNVDYASKRNETFYDIQLNIRSERGNELRSIEESLEEFTAEETLDGDNLYEAEGHGKQAAKKGIRFLRFPPVLNLQLKRFHFDLEKMDMVKLNTRFEFQKRLDLSQFVPEAGSYVLYAVLVHSGDVNSGHYYAYIKPDRQAGWLKFDDDSVTPCSEYAAVDDNYAGSDLSIWNYFDRTPRELRGVQVPVRPRIHNAYILVYIREDLAGQLLAPPDPRLTNPKMVDRCEREVRNVEQRLREKKEQQTKIKIKLVFERNLVKMSGFWDFAEIPHEHSFKMGRDQMVKDLAAEVEALAGVPRNNVALFYLQYRNNPRQVRFAFMPQASNFRQHIPNVNSPHFDLGDPHLMVLVVAAKEFDIHTLKPISPSVQPDELARWKQKEEEETVILLVAKYFCPTTRKVVTLGCHYGQFSDPLHTMVTSCWLATRLRPYIESKEVAPVSEQDLGVTDVDAVAQQWMCWEEFNANDIQPRDVSKKIKEEHLVTGDVIVWQLALAAGEPSSPEVDRSVEVEGEVAPIYPVQNVLDLALHIANSADVIVTLHDYHQPLCVDGVVSNGHWGPPRPASAAPLTIAGGKDSKGSAQPPSPANAKEETPEAQALALSPVQFTPAQEKEIKMDLRWHLRHVTGTIARTFGLSPAAANQLWLFHAAPASNLEDPLNTQRVQGEQTTLKDLKLSSSHLLPLVNPGRRRTEVHLHAVALPWELGSQVFERNLCPLCIRFFDAQVREVGSCLITVPTIGTVQDIMTEASAQLRPEWGITAPLRVLEVSEGRLHRICRPDHAITSLACFSRSNIFYHCLRVESDTEAGGLLEGHQLMEIYHCDRQSQQAWGQPLLMPVAPGEKSGAIKARVKAKYQISDGEFKNWRLARYIDSRTARVGPRPMKDDEIWDAEPDAKLYLEHPHPNPNAHPSRQSRYNKPLTIK